MENDNDNEGVDGTFYFDGWSYGGSGISGGWNTFSSSFSKDPIKKFRLSDSILSHAEERVFSVVYLDPIGEKRFENGLTLNQAKTRINEIQSDFKEIIIFVT